MNRINYTNKIALFIFLPLMMSLFYIQQINVNIAYFVLAIQCISFISCIKTIKIYDKAAQGIILALLYILFVICVFSGLFSDFKMRSLKLSFLVFVPSIFLFLLTISDSNPNATFIKIFEIATKIGVIFAFVAIILFLFGSIAYTSGGRTIQVIKLGPLKFFQIVMGRPPYYRVSSLTSNPNTLGIILMLGQIATIYLFSIKIITNKKFVILYIVQIIGLLLTQSRSAILTAFMMIIFYSILTHEKKSDKIKISIASIIFIVSMYYIIGSGKFGIFNRFHSGLSNRDLAWDILIKHIAKNPFIGIGFGVSSETLLYDLGIKTHNVFLNCLSEIGLVGFLVFISIWSLGLIYSFISIKNNKKNGKQKNSYALVFSILFSCIFHQMVENKLLVYDFTMFLWVYLVSFSTINLDMSIEQKYVDTRIIKD